MSARPRVFIGSSTGGLGLAKALEVHLSRECEVTVWDSGVFRLSRSALDSLMVAIAEHDFAVLVLTPDDVVESRSKVMKAPRDNVVFELGLFLGSRGPEHTFIVADPAEIKMPSDLFGLTVATYKHKRSDGNTSAQMSPPSTKILEEIRRNYRRPMATLSPAPVLLSDREEVYEAVANFTTANSGVVICGATTEWAWRLYPTVLDWRLKGTPVTAYLTALPHDDVARRREAVRRALLRNLGVKVVNWKSLPLTGFLLDLASDDDMEGILFGAGPDPGGVAPIAARYTGRVHQVALDAVRKRLPPSWRSHDSMHKPALSPCEVETVVKKLRQGVRQYREGSVSLRGTRVPVRDLLLSTQYVRSYKLRQIDRLWHTLTANGIAPFEPTYVAVADGKKEIITPPVVESTSGGLVVLEGSTRAFYHSRRGIEEMYCILVEGVVEPLPTVPVPVASAEVAPKELPHTERMASFEYSRFRHIERAVHPY